MTKEEVKNALVQSGELERFNKTDLWEKAFALYKAETKDYDVSVGCSNCFIKVKNWLLR